MPSDTGDRRQAKPHPPPENEHLHCPRCSSTDTKFCYYNNYNFSQPRHFCKSCRRYWTHGGTLRNIPACAGSANRKNAKRSRTSSPSQDPIRAIPISVCPASEPDLSVPLLGDANRNVNVSGSFTWLLNMQEAPGGFVLGLEDVGLGGGVWALKVVDLKALK
ncbi:hypothetical protein HHK36_008452 [Tetracentron sinense]|uniref:Dof zinc finger protein n=1 Tax=Tetracentron sinense TaxID=13715 RepID=A0A834ZIH2_TETSI|nr:hypothetical protein HHK36_008452 [Tetracentron sinense]